MRSRRAISERLEAGREVKVEDEDDDEGDENVGGWKVKVRGQEERLRARLRLSGEVKAKLGLNFNLNFDLSLPLRLRVGSLLPYWDRAKVSWCGLSPSGLFECFGSGTLTPKGRWKRGIKKSPGLSGLIRRP